MNEITALLTKHRRWKTALIVVLGGLAGFSYYYFIGCRTGSCPIAGNPYISTIYGLLIGFLFSFNKKGKVNE